MNNKTDINVQYVSPLKKICMTIGELPSSYLETMSYYEMLVWFTEFLKNQVIPTVNNNAEAVQELQSLYEELRIYVNNYFDNLDVQDEINNKLDEMAESGQLTDIIAQYLGLAGMIAFDTVSDMKEAQNLVNGSKCRTLGYHSVNDGGGAYYKIRQVTNDDVVDEMFIIEVYDNLLVAELQIEDSYVNTNQVGLISNDNTFDNSTLFASLISKCNSKGLNIEFNKGIYYFSNPIVLNYRLQAMNIKGQGLPYTDYNNGTTLRYTGSGWFIDLNKCWKCTFKDFQVESAENGIKMSDSFFQSHLENVHFLNCKNAIHLKQFAYAYLTNIQINTNNANSEFALKVGETTTDWTEYLFVNGFINEDDAIHSSNDGIVIVKGIHLSFENVDLVKKNQAIVVQPVELIRYLYFTNIDIARSHIGFNFDTKTNTKGMSAIDLNKIMCSFRENPDASDRYLIASKGTGVVIRNLVTKEVSIVSLSGNPSYAIEQLDTNVFSDCRLTIENNYNGVPSKIKLNDFEGNVLADYYQSLHKVTKIFNNTPSSSVTLTLLTNSPFYTEPKVRITSNKPVIKSYTVSNTNGGNLTATITFTDDFAAGGNAEFYTSIDYYDYNQSSV